MSTSVEVCQATAFKQHLRFVFLRLRDTPGSALARALIEVPTKSDDSPAFYGVLFGTFSAFDSPCPQVRQTFYAEDCLLPRNFDSPVRRRPVQQRGGRCRRAAAIQQSEGADFTHHDDWTFWRVYHVNGLHYGVSGPTRGLMVHDRQRFPDNSTASLACAPAWLAGADQ
jgi:hypothetical protein